MEGDKEFGYIYTDVLRPFPPSSAPQTHPVQPSPKRAIDLNAQPPEDDDDDDIRICNAPNFNIEFTFSSSNISKDLSFHHKKATPVAETNLAGISDSRLNLSLNVKQEDEEANQEENVGLPQQSGSRVLETEDNKDNLEDQGGSDATKNGNDTNHGSAKDDLDSDSEDDLQILLDDNDNGPIPMVMDGAETVERSEDEDENGDPLVILADNGPGHQPMEKQERGDSGETAAQVPDGERKKLGDGDAAKVNGGLGLAVVPQTGFINHACYPYHSQFKYVRPGAAPTSGAPVGPAGGPAQVLSPLNMAIGPGHGKGDWRPTGTNYASPLQKSLQAGFGKPVWENNTYGRGFGCGLEFTLPSYMTIFEVDVDSFEEKPWRPPGIDKSVFFNFGLNEESWKDYRKQLEHLRLETIMQSRICVYESGRTEQPTGRAIQVETRSGERIPSFDFRPPRARDSDATIEIVLQGSEDYDSDPQNGAMELPVYDTSEEDCRGGKETEIGIGKEDTEHPQGFPCAYSGQNGGLLNKRATVKNSLPDYLTNGYGMSFFLQEAPVQYSDSGGQTSADPHRDDGTTHEERPEEGRVRDRSPTMVNGKTILNKSPLGKQKEDSFRSIGQEHSPRLSSPLTVGSTEEPDIKHDGGLHDGLVLVHRSSEMNGEEITLTRSTEADTHVDENPLPSARKRRLSSRIEQSSVRGVDKGRNSRTPRSCENSKARSGSSRDYWKRPHDEEEQGVRIKGRRDVRLKMEKHPIFENSAEDCYSHRDWDLQLAECPGVKSEAVDRESVRNSVRSWQWQDGKHHGRNGRTKDARKSEFVDEIGLIHLDKVRESEKMTQDKRIQLRELLNHGESRGKHDKILGSRHMERNEKLKSRSGSMDDLHSNRRKVYGYLMQAAEKKEILHGHRAHTSGWKRKRDGRLDLTKRNDHVRTTKDEYYSDSHRQDACLHKERESSLKREREDRWRGVRSGEGAGDQGRVGDTRLKDGYMSSDRDHRLKDNGWQSEQFRRKDLVDNGNLSQNQIREDVHEQVNQLRNDKRRSKQAWTGTHYDYSMGGSDKKRSHEKQVVGTSKNSEGHKRNSRDHSKRHQEDYRGQMNELVILKGLTEHEILVNHELSREHTEDASSDYKQHNSRRGRSKLECWTGHKERDFIISTKPSFSLKVKKVFMDDIDGSSLARRLQAEPSEKFEVIDREIMKPLDGSHIDNVEKMKKRSGRFKLPMPSDKEAPEIEDRG